jgi:hypothetical protein
MTGDGPPHRTIGDARPEQSQGRRFRRNSCAGVGLVLRARRRLRRLGCAIAADDAPIDGPLPSSPVAEAAEENDPSASWQRLPRGPGTGIRLGAGRECFETNSTGIVRTMFLLYTLLIVGGIVFCVAVGLTQQ